MPITSNLPKCVRGHSQVTVADRVAFCQLSWLGYEFLVSVCPIYEKKHQAGLSHLYEQIHCVYRASAHSLADEQVLIKPR